MLSSHSWFRVQRVLEWGLELRHINTATAGKPVDECQFLIRTPKGSLHCHASIQPVTSWLRAARRMDGPRICICICPVAHKTKFYLFHSRIQLNFSTSRSSGGRLGRGDYHIRCFGGRGSSGSSMGACSGDMEEQQRQYHIGSNALNIRLKALDATMNDKRWSASERLYWKYGRIVEIGEAPSLGADSTGEEKMKRRKEIRRINGKRTFMCVYVCMFIYICICMYIYIFIYRMCRCGDSKGIIIIRQQHARQDRNFACKTGHIVWYLHNLDLYEISKIKIYNFLWATYAIQIYDRLFSNSVQ